MNPEKFSFILLSFICSSVLVRLQPGPAYITRRAGGGASLTGSQSITLEKKQAEIFLEYPKTDRKSMCLQTLIQIHLQSEAGF